MSRLLCVSFDQEDCFVSNAVGQKIDPLTPIVPHQLAGQLKASGLVGAKARAVLSSRDYQLLRVKRPSVAAADMKEALLWQEQAHFSVPADQLIIEFVDCRTAGGDKQIYLIAVSKPALQLRYDALKLAGLDVKNLTIPEFVYGEYIQQNMPSTRLVIWVHLFADKSQALAYLDGDLVATSKLPQESDERRRVLSLFYDEQLAGFQEESVWLMNAEALPLRSLEDLSLITDSRVMAMNHAYYGGMIK